MLAKTTPAPEDRGRLAQWSDSGPKENGGIAVTLRDLFLGVLPLLGFATLGPEVIVIFLCLWIGLLGSINDSNLSMSNEYNTHAVGAPSCNRKGRLPRRTSLNDNYQYHTAHPA